MKMGENHCGIIAEVTSSSLVPPTCLVKRPIIVILRLFNPFIGFMAWLLAWHIVVTII